MRQTAMACNGMLDRQALMRVSLAAEDTSFPIHGLGFMDDLLEGENSLMDYVVRPFTSRASLDGWIFRTYE
jgi:hypothetical protein